MAPNLSLSNADKNLGGLTGIRLKLIPVNDGLKVQRIGYHANLMEEHPWAAPLKWMFGLTWHL